MKQRCNPPRLDELDWNQIDFTRFNLGDVAQNPVAKAVAGLAQQFFESPEWQEGVQSSMPQLQQVALGVYKEHANGLRESRTAAARDFDQRAAGAKSRSEDLRRAMAASAAPHTPEAGRDVYHLAVRVTGADSRLGFPGLVVEIADPRNQEAEPLATGTTDINGNITLTVEAEAAKEIDKRDTTVTVFSPSGKVLVRMPDGVCVRLNQVETKVITVKESEETAPLRQAALDTRQSRELQLANADSRLQSLAKDREERLANLDCAVREADGIIADLERPPDFEEILKRALAGVAPRPSPAPSTPPSTPPPSNTPGTPPVSGTRPTPSPPPAPPSAAPAPTPGVRPAPSPAPAPPVGSTRPNPAAPAIPATPPVRPVPGATRSAAMKAPPKPKKPKGKKK